MSCKTYSICMFLQCGVLETLNCIKCALVVYFKFTLKVYLKKLYLKIISY